MAKGKKKKEWQEGQKGQEKSCDGEEEIREEIFEESCQEVGEEGQEVGEEIRQEVSQKVQGGRAEESRQEGRRQEEPCKEGGQARCTEARRACV